MMARLKLYTIEFTLIQHSNREKTAVFTALKCVELNTCHFYRNINTKWVSEFSDVNLIT